MRGTAPPSGGLFVLALAAVPELTRCAGIKLDARVWLRRHLGALSMEE
jgi:hypothetical protein